ASGIPDPLRKKDNSTGHNQNGGTEREHHREFCRKPQFAPDVDREGSVGTRKEIRDQELVKGDDERQKQARDDSRKGKRKSNARERHPGIFTQIARGFLETNIETLESRHQHCERKRHTNEYMAHDNTYKR